jgi:transcriptional regulator with XRE-family HTH domain
MAKSKKQPIRQAEITQAFARRLRAIRASCDITQRELAERAIVTVSYISKLEAGGAAPGIDLVERLAKALNVTIADLLPAPPPADAAHEQAQRLFEKVIAEAGPESLLLLKLFLARLADSPDLSR